MTKIGITEKGDAGLDLTWVDKLDSVDGCILITKNPTPTFLELIEKYKDKLIVHVTITGVGGSLYEPNVPKPYEVYPLFNKVLDILGPEKTVLRIDPIIPTTKGILAAHGVFVALVMREHRIRVSILDNYPHVKQRFIEAGVPPVDYEFHADFKVRNDIINLFGSSVEICGEPGFRSIGCVSQRDVNALGLHLTDEDEKSQFKQRRGCTCLGIKTELLTNREPCPYGCLYCYWKD